MTTGVTEVKSVIEEQCGSEVLVEQKYIRDIGFAAFLKLRGFELQGCSGRAFCFLIDKSAYEQLRLEYTNSCCRLHNNEVQQLKQFI